MRPRPVFVVPTVLTVMAAGLVMAASPAPAGSAGAASTPIPVTDDTEYIQALLTLSSDPNGPHTIVLEDTINILGAADPTYTGDQDLLIDGQGEHALGGQGNSRVLVGTQSDITLTLRDVGVVDGYATGNGGGVQWGNGLVTLDNVVLRGNRVMAAADVAGGGVYSTFDVAVQDSVLDDNRIASTSGTARGGAVAAGPGNGGVTVERSVLTDNRADGTTLGGGGAIHGEFDTVITDSVLAGNGSTGTTAVGGAIDSGPVEIIGSVMDGNQAVGTTTARGGAVNGSDDISVRDSTLVDNEVGAVTTAGGSALFTPFGASADNSTFTGRSGSGTVGGVINAPGESVDLRHVTVAPAVSSSVSGVVAGQFTSEASVITATADDCQLEDAPVSNGHNYDTDGSCGFGAGTGDVSDGDDPLLGQARNNGDLVAAAEAGGNGTVRATMFPLNGSPLIDAIPAGSCSAAPELDLDQRGVDRAFGAGCDIGAIESVFPTHAMTDVTPFYEATVRWVTSTVNAPQILSGYPDNTFGQSLPINRGQTARLYYRAAGAPDVSGLPAHGFGDVSPFFEDGVRWAKSEGLFDGFPDNTFRETSPINRGNYTRSLYNFVGMPDVTGLPAHGFSDVSLFYEDAVTWAKGNGLADGFPDGTYAQTADINRGNAGRIFYNTAQTKPAWDDTMTAPPNMLFKDNLIP